MKFAMGYEANAEKCSGKILKAELYNALSLSLSLSSLLRVRKRLTYSPEVFRIVHCSQRSTRKRGRGEAWGWVQGRFLLYQWETLCCQKRSRFSIEMDRGRRLYELAFYYFRSSLLTCVVDPSVDQYLQLCLFICLGIRSFTFQCPAFVQTLESRSQGT